jgi:hypothetical protein
MLDYRLAVRDLRNYVVYRAGRAGKPRTPHGADVYHVHVTGRGDAMSLCEWVSFAGEGRECAGDFVEVGADVCCGGSGVAVAVVSGVGACHGVAEVPFDPGQCGVA